MDFTREPVIETVITPREGCKLVVRSSRGVSQEEYFVDAVEVVTFGNALFFRSLEKPKSFLLPVTEYEVLEVREARLVLKHVGIDRSIKISGGREAALRPPRDPMAAEKSTSYSTEEQTEVAAEETTTSTEGRPEARTDKKRERRRHGRRRRGQEEREGAPAKESSSGESVEKVELPEPRRPGEISGESSEGESANPVLRTLLPPPPTLISETIARYREDALFKDAFYSRDEKGNEGNEAVELSAASDELEPTPAGKSEENRENVEENWNFTQELFDNKTDKTP